MHSFHVVAERAVSDILSQNHAQLIELVTRAYEMHDRGDVINPDSSFLLFPNQPRDRIIALPASVRGDVNVAGIKWISSFPANIDRGVPRASAVLILNDAATGFPIACLEGSAISAARTAASAALGARWINQGQRAARGLGIVGAGFIARNIIDMLRHDGRTFPAVNIWDVSPSRAASLAEDISPWHDHVRITDSAGDLMQNSDLIVFATTAPTPWFDDASALPHNPAILHVSLRDLSADIILGSNNLVDDVDHCLKQKTSVHLAEIQSGNRDFINGTIAELMQGQCHLQPDRPTIFSPFGMGMLDLVVGEFVYRRAIENGTAMAVPNFFGA